MIVDTSVLIALLREEADSDTYADLLLESDEAIRISAATYLEAAIVLDRNDDPALSSRLDGLLHELAIAIEPITAEQARLARQAHREYGRGSGHPAKLNFGDCFSYALAKAAGEPLLYKGRDFTHTDVVSASG